MAPNFMALWGINPCAQLPELCAKSSPLHRSPGPALVLGSTAAATAPVGCVLW